jgi:hypothetical protein
MLLRIFRIKGRVLILANLEKPMRRVRYAHALVVTNTFLVSPFIAWYAARFYIENNYSKPAGKPVLYLSCRIPPTPYPNA